jgi:predicted alpha/beta hydrolase family esterase
MTDLSATGSKPFPRSPRGSARRLEAETATIPKHIPRGSISLNAAMTPTVVIVPGLRDHIAHHWQTLLEAKLPKVVTVPRLTPGTLSRAVWIAKVAGPIIFVAHSAGVMITVHWAQTYFRPILGALLATPPDFENPLPEGYPTVEQLKTHGWLPTPRARLPFTSIVAASTNDPLARYERAAELASAWGSRLVNIGAVGHLNPAAGFGEWPQAEKLIRKLTRAGARTSAAKTRRLTTAFARAD